MLASPGVRREDKGKRLDHVKFNSRPLVPGKLDFYTPHWATSWGYDHFVANSNVQVRLHQEGLVLVPVQQSCLWLLGRAQGLQVAWYMGRTACTRSRTTKSMPNDTAYRDA